MRYMYSAKKGPSEVVQGAVDAENQDAAVAKIIEQGLVPVLVEEEGVYRRKGSPSRQAPRAKTALFGGGANRSHVYFFTKKLKTLMKSQIPILSCLYMLEEQAEHARFREVLSSMIAMVRDGANFSQTLERYPALFPPLYTSIIKAGEASGTLETSLDQIARYLDNERQMSMKVKSSLAYPAMMIAVGAATIIFLMTFVIPKLTILFVDFADRLPAPTKILMAISAFLSKNQSALFISIIAGAVFLFYTRGSAWQRRMAYRIKKKTPIVRGIIYNESLSRLARGLSVLLSSGVSVLDAIKISAPLVDDPDAQRDLGEAYKRIMTGTGLEESFRSTCAFLPDMFIRMVAIGEASGRLDEILLELANGYAEEVEAKTKMMTSLIEPMAILVVGGVLSFIVVAVLLPIFEISFFIQ
jgi:general secretion pathway protein F